MSFRYTNLIAEHRQLLSALKSCEKLVRVKKKEVLPWKDVPMMTDFILSPTAKRKHS